MRPQGRSDRRHRGHKGQDDEHYSDAHGDEGRADTYSRRDEMPHRNETFRASSTVGRTSYDSNREASTSRANRHSASWRRSDHEEGSHRYSSSEGYRRHGRDDFEGTDRRETEGWSGRSHDAQYSQTRGEWPQRYDRGYVPSSYAESSSWSTSNPTSHDDRTMPFERWSPDDPSLDDHHSIPVADERHIEREPLEWHRDQRRDKGSHKFQSDSGWNSRRRKGWGDQNWDDTIQKKEVSNTGDRSWEPAPNWQPIRRSEHEQTGRTNRRNDNIKQYAKPGKRSVYPVRPKRDWRGDENNLNNWQKRDNANIPGGSSKPPVRKKHLRSSSRSRSRSPDSFYSRRSSRGRSRSRSMSPLPKRRRREDSPTAPRSRTPSDKGRAIWNPPSRNSRDLSLSPNMDSRSHRSSDGFGRRGRSISSISSVSSGRSRSRSPPGVPRAVHRLPSMAAPSLPSLPSPFIRPPKNGSRFSNTQRNGKGQFNGMSRKDTEKRHDENPYGATVRPATSQLSAYVPGEHNKRHANSFANDRRHPFAPQHETSVYPHATKLSDSRHPASHGESARSFFAHPSDPPYLHEPPRESERRYINSSGNNTRFDVMPPPDTFPTAQPAHPASISRPDLRTTSDLSEIKTNSPTPPRFTPVKHTGFKPISHTSSALKKFFPTDDDEPEFPTESNTSVQHNRPIFQVQPDKPTTFPKESTRDLEYERISKVSPPEALQRPISPLHAPVSTGNTLPNSMENARNTLSPQGRILSELDSTHIPPTPSTRSGTEIYDIISQVGEGTFGKVYKAQNTVTKLYVALKRIRMESEKDGFPVTAMREIKLLQSLRHPNVVRLYEMMVSNGSVYMVFEYMDHDLTGVLSQTQFSFTDAHLKSLCHQMLAGLAYLHHKGVIHRDIKGSNILINNRGELKLADFGLARFYQKRRCTDYTNRVITLWYRPPELLFGATVYGPEVDMWSAGCIMLELFTKKPVFQGNDEIHQLDVVYKIIGTPTPERWASVLDLPWYELVKPKETIPNRFRELFQKWMSPAALDLAERLLAYDPIRRVSALQAMDAPYFTQEEPRALLPTGLATLEGEWHELETKRERAKKRKKTEAALLGQ